MPTLDVGRGIALQGTFDKADRLWASDYTNKANAVIAEKKAKELAKEKAIDNINKFLNTSNSGLHRIYQDEAKKRTSDFLVKFYDEMQGGGNPNTAEIQQEYSKLKSDIERWKTESENINKTAAIKAEHPSNFFVDEKINDIMNNGTYDDYVKIKGDDTFPLMYGLKPAADLNEVIKFATPMSYQGVKPETETKMVDGMLVTNEVIRPNVDRYKEGAYLSWKQDPVLQNQFPLFDDLYAQLPQPQPQYKLQGVRTPPKEKGSSGFGGIGNKSGTVNVKQYTRSSDGAIVTELKDNTSANDPKLFEIPDKELEVGGKRSEEVTTIKDPKIVVKNGRLFVEGNEKDKSVEDVTIPGKYRIIEIRPTDKGLSLVQKLSNTFANVPVFEIGDDGKWKDVGVNNNINLRNYDNSGLKPKSENKQEAPKVSYVTVSNGADVDLTGASEQDIKKAIKAGLIKIKK